MTNSTDLRFGDLLRQLRKRASMTQRDLAAAVGYSVSFVCDLEQNRRLPTVAGVLHQFERVGVALAPVEIARIRRQAEGLLAKTVEGFVHG